MKFCVIFVSTIEGLCLVSRVSFVSSNLFCIFIRSGFQRLQVTRPKIDQGLPRVNSMRFVLAGSEIRFIHRVYTEEQDNP